MTSVKSALSQGSMVNVPPGKGCPTSSRISSMLTPIEAPSAGGGSSRRTLIGVTGVLRDAARRQICGQALDVPSRAFPDGVLKCGAAELQRAEATRLSANARSRDCVQRDLDQLLVLRAAMLSEEHQACVGDE